MLSVQTLALGLSILIINTSALPVPDVLEVRDLSPALSPRSEGFVELGSPVDVEKRQIPTKTGDISLVLSLLGGHGFEPTQGFGTKTTARSSTKATITPTAKATTTARSITPIVIANPTTTARSITPIVIAKPTTTARSTTPIVIAKPTTTAKSTTPLVVVQPSTTLKTTTKASITPFLNLFGIPTVKTSTSSTRATSTIKPTTTRRARGLSLPRRTPLPARAVF